MCLSVTEPDRDGAVDEDGLCVVLGEKARADDLAESVSDAVQGVVACTLRCALKTIELAAECGAGPCVAPGAVEV